MRRITLIVLCLLFSGRLFASHTASAEIRYDYTGSGNIYRVTLTVIKICLPNNANLGVIETISLSSSCNSTFSKSLQVISIDTMGMVCPGLSNSCVMPQSIYAGFETRVYSDTVVLPPCLDWKLSWALCCKNAAILNLNNPSGFDTYAEATLNNSNAPNSSPIIANVPFHLLALNQPNTVPIQAIDAENDNIVYEWVQPATAFGVIPYVSPYTFANPLNGTSTIDQVNQTMLLQTATLGKYNLAIRTKDYRNGTLVGTSIRDFMVLANSTGALTTPMPAPGTNMHYATCPGQSNSITLNFIDSSATDSVFLDVSLMAYPSVPGLSFSPVSATGVGSATATITWTTPSTLNPANTPHFYFLIKAGDNSCPARAVAHYTFAVHTAQCSTDSVWAGDANGDYTLNVYDPLAVAVAYGTTGWARTGPMNINWVAQYCTAWSTSFINNVNMKHADCDGNGLVDNVDLTAVNNNFGMVHLKGGPKAKTTGVPDLYFDVVGINFAPGATVSVPIKLGSAVSPMNNVYGVASHVSIGGIILTSSPSITYPTGWLGTVANTLSFIKALNINTMAWAYARTDHQNVSGNGTIAMLTFTIPSTATVGAPITLSFNNNSMIVNKDLQSITGYNELDTTVAVGPLSVGVVNNKISYAVVVPNPSQNNASLQMMLSERAALNISVTDVAGRIVYRQELKASKGENNILLPASSLPAGMYLIKIMDGNAVQTVKWMKQ